MFQRAPIEILAADKRLLAIHHQVFGVDDPTAHPRVGQHAKGQVGDRAQAFQGGRFRQPDAFFFQQKANLHTAFAGGFQAFDHTVHHRAWMIGGVELANVDSVFCAIEQLAPHRAGLAQVVGTEGGVHRHGVHQFKPRNRKVRLGQRTHEQACQACDAQFQGNGHRDSHQKRKRAHCAPAVAFRPCGCAAASAPGAVLHSARGRRWRRGSAGFSAGR